MKIIHVTVSPQGEIRLETRGFAGSSCEAASRELIAALGVVTTAQQTSEYFAATESALRQQIAPRSGGTP